MILKMPVRPEKVEEIKAVWDSPKFKTNAQRLVHLLVIAEESNTATQYVNLLMLYSLIKWTPTRRKMTVGMNTSL